MRRTLLAAALLLAACRMPARAAEPTVRDLLSDTWVGVDALGRTMPDSAAVGPVKTDHRRAVGIFYITWHSDGAHGMKSPYTADVSRVLRTDPKARLDAKHPLWTEGSYHWGEPEAGYFLSRDEWLIRRDMSMLADAGVDVLVMDVTNAVRYWEEWDTVFPVMERMRAEGNRVPQFCFWAFNGPVITVVQDLYERIYKAGKYRDLWYQWDGKPLLLYNGNPASDANGKGPDNPNPHYVAAAKTDPAHPHYGDPEFCEPLYHDYTKDVKSFFTLRTMWWGYYEWAGKRFVGTEDNWSFGLDLGDRRVQALTPAELVSRHQGRREEAAVTPAQHPASRVGKSWTREHAEPHLDERDLPVATQVPWLGKKVEHPEGYGIYFQQRWDEALKGDPQFLYLNDWNEWTAGKYDTAPGKTTRFMERDSGYQFIDQYNSEFNRTIQPMKGGYTDNYYMQMAQNIRRYKGARPIPALRGRRTIRIDGRFADWDAETVEYRDTIGDTAHRDARGYGGLKYRDESGRNDIVSAKVAVDRRTVAFLARTNAPLTAHTGHHWMVLLIDADRNHATGWNGYDYAVNLRVVDARTTMLSRYDPASPDGPWVEVARVPYRAAGSALEVAIPRSLIGLRGDALTFDFKWTDNAADLDDPISFCTTGDTAPNRRFNYRCIWRR